MSDNILSEIQAKNACSAQSTHNSQDTSTLTRVYQIKITEYYRFPSVPQGNSRSTFLSKEEQEKKRRWSQDERRKKEGAHKLLMNKNNQDRS
jgi:hypothetical protein